MKATMVCVVTVAALAGGSSASAQGFAGIDEIVPAVTGCAYTFGSGSGADAFVWCLSTNGNIMRFESPAGQNHQPNSAEGVAVCSASGTHGADFANVIPVPFGPPSVVAGCTSGSSCTIQRDTTDGAFRLIEKFTQNKKEKELNIDHTLTNIGAVTRTSVILTRMSLFVVNMGGGDRGDRSPRSAWLSDADSIVSRADTFKEPASAFVVGNFPAGCAPAGGGVPTPAPPGVYANQINYELGALAPGKKKIVRVQIRRQ